MGHVGRNKKETGHIKRPSEPVMDERYARFNLKIKTNSDLNCCRRWAGVKEKDWEPIKMDPQKL